MASQPASPPPPAPLDAAAAAATSKPLPIPQPDTSRAALQGATSWLPGPLQPVGMLAVGLAKAAWTVPLLAARIGGARSRAAERVDRALRTLERRGIGRRGAAATHDPLAAFPPLEAADALSSNTLQRKHL